MAADPEVIVRGTRPVDGTRAIAGGWTAKERDSLHLHLSPSHSAASPKMIAGCCSMIAEHNITRDVSHPTIVLAKLCPGRTNLVVSSGSPG